MASPATPLIRRNKHTEKAFRQSDFAKDREISGRRIGKTGENGWVICGPLSSLE